MRLRAWVYTKEQLNAALRCGQVEYVYASIRLIDGETANCADRIILLPPEYLADCEESVSKQLSELKSAGFKKALAHTVGHIELLRELGYDIFGGSRLNCTNTEAMRFFTEQGISDIILSPELTAAQTGYIAKAARGSCTVGITAYGKLPLMLTRRCPINDGKPCGRARDNKRCNKQLTDRMGKKLDVICSLNTVEILNSDTLVLSDKLGSFDVDFAVLRFTVEKDIMPVIEAYSSGKSLSLKNITRGLYFRGVE